MKPVLTVEALFIGKRHWVVVKNIQDNDYTFYYLYQKYLKFKFHSHNYWFNKIIIKTGYSNIKRNCFFTNANKLLYKCIRIKLNII